MKVTFGFVFFVDILFVCCCLVMPRSGMEAMGSVFVMIPLAGFHFLLGLILSIISLRKKTWGIPLYFVLASFFMGGMWHLYSELKPTYRPLYHALARKVKLQGREFASYKDYKILEVRRFFAKLKNPALAELCVAIEYPPDFQKVSSALSKNPDLSGMCALLHGRESLPLLALLQESFEPWIREEKAQQEQQLVRLNKVLKSLLETGADPNVRGEKGNSPLHLAARYDESLLVASLLEYNSCVYLENDEKISAIKSTRNFETRQILKKAAEDPAMVDNCPHLINQDSSSAAEDKAGYQERGQGKQLFYGVTNGRIDIVTHNVAKGVDVNSRDKRGRAPLHLATTCKTEMAAIIEILTKAGADINSRDKRGRTPLLASADNHCPEVMAILLKKGADPALSDKKGATVLHQMARWKA